MDKQLSKHWRVFGHPGAKALGLLPRDGRAGEHVEECINFAAGCAEKAGAQYTRKYGILVLGAGNFADAVGVPVKAREATIRTYNCDGELLMAYTDRQAGLYQAMELPISGTCDNVVGKLVYDDQFGIYGVLFDPERVYEGCEHGIQLDAQDWDAATRELFHEYGLTCSSDLSYVHDWSGAYAPQEAHDVSD